MSDSPKAHSERLYFFLVWEGSPELFFCSDRLSRKEAKMLLKALDREEMPSLTWTTESRLKKADSIRMRVEARRLEEYLDPDECRPFGPFIPVGAIDEGRLLLSDFRGMAKEVEAEIIASRVGEKAPGALADEKAPALREVHDLSPKAIADLEKATPPLDKDSGKWVNNKRAAKIEGLETRTLSSYRRLGIKNADRSLGRDIHCRIWRREGTPGSHPWYLRSSLCSQQNR